jgi:hypothetical protein
VGILNAYYLPGVTEGGLYDSTTLVNPFGLVFNLYFEGNLALLPEGNVVHTSGPFNRVDVTDRLR